MSAHHKRGDHSGKHKTLNHAEEITFPLAGRQFGLGSWNDGPRWMRMIGTEFNKSQIVFYLLNFFDWSWCHLIPNSVRTAVPNEEEPSAT